MLKARHVGAARTDRGKLPLQWAPIIPGQPGPLLKRNQHHPSIEWSLQGKLGFSKLLRFASLMRQLV